MIVSGRILNWIRNGFAGIGVLASVLAAVVFATEVADRGLRLKLISANFESGQLEAVRVAVHDPRSGGYFLVQAWHPLVQPVARALL